MFTRISSILVLVATAAITALPASAQAQSAKDLFCRGVYEFGADRYGEAIQSFSQVIRLNPRSSGSYFYRGAVHHRRKQYPQAIANYNQALSIGTTHPSVVLNNRAAALASLGDYKQTLEDLKLALKYQPNNYSLRRALAFTFLKLGSRQSAISVLEKLTATYFQTGFSRDYLRTRDEVKAVRAGGNISYTWQVYDGIPTEEDCP